MKAYIAAGYRSPVGKAPKGGLRFVRPDDLAVVVIKHMLKQFPQLPLSKIEDVVVGNAVPEAEQGMQMARYISLLALGQETPGITINRYCGSGLEAIALASARIEAGMADCIIAGGTESMSLVPTTGHKMALNYDIASSNPDYYVSMGLTAEEVARKFGITREEQDEFALKSHQKAIKAQQAGKFDATMAPVPVKEIYFDVASGKKKTREYVVSKDEGPRVDTNIDALNRLRPVFSMGGSVTAGNSSQTSDGAAFVLVMSGRLMKELGIKPIAKLISYAVAGCEPSLMGIGPVYAIPKALEQANLKLEDIDKIELNEAFASQALAVIKELKLDLEKVNPNGGAIALGHALGSTGARLSVQLFDELRRNNETYGMVSACVGGGQGVAGIFKMVNEIE